MKVELCELDMAEIHAALTARVLRAVESITEAKHLNAGEETLGILGRLLDRRSAALQRFEAATGYRPTTVGVETQP